MRDSQGYDLHEGADVTLDVAGEIERAVIVALSSGSPGYGDLVVLRLATSYPGERYTARADSCTLVFRCDQCGEFKPYAKGAADSPACDDCWAAKVVSR